MKKNTQPVYYGEYLKLDKLLSAQEMESSKYNDKPAHEEMLFVIVHQVYELWFKQILHELSTVIDIFAQEEVKDDQLTLVVHRLKRVLAIQDLLNDQIGVMETMTPQEFLEFRDYLVPASGFQSIQFKILEISLGLKTNYRIEFDKQSFYMRLKPEHREFLEKLESQDSLLELVEKWLERMPFLEFENFDFWRHYRDATNDMMSNDKDIILNNQMMSETEREKELKDLDMTAASFDALLDPAKYEEVKASGQFRMSQRAVMSALFIQQYSEEPIFNLPCQFLQCLTEVDEKLTIWRYKHAMMVQRMLGTKIGTGGSSGHDYLKKTTESNRIFKDFFNMATFILAKSALPPLPANVKKALGFSLTSV
ncbi:tryptophan 2,3-dioxygenase [Paraneptunicella aestuarii]|uniref:tryptophan 2,3-dioxygenase family protein n=1 Tax=Paraneptunicella aestuarii TaxID=2831148 RepID=UPI001E2C7B2F|nr:tryptophan 2,3-dioxygenase family protein [Paraneptunicella aestuarii]UAA37780.1 tryptophan 2,3-dioxygenase [Paraneptunicella aestuarii]